MKKQLIKQIPATDSDFSEIIRNNNYYIDKTRYIHYFEESQRKFAVFLRPRRFGKSLFLSTLHYYYGIEHKNSFQELFGSYFIGDPKNTTTTANSYYILRFDFSGIYTQNKDTLQKDFTARVFAGISSFLDRYGLNSDKLAKDKIDSTSGHSSLESFFRLLSEDNFKGRIFILIDEYDHFTNELFSFDLEFFKDIVTRNGWVRKFYETIKIYVGAGYVSRFFATGVTPVTLDAMTSGFNITRNLTFQSELHEMMGFTEAEVLEMINGTFEEPESLNIDQIILDIRAWYNGSRFSDEGAQKLYNPQMMCYFLDSLKRTGKYPNPMADITVASDYAKISKIMDLLPGKISSEIIDEVLENESIREGLTLQFNFELNISKVDLVSLLFYNGLLTIESVRANTYTYIVPNYVIKQLYWAFFRSKLSQKLDFEYSNPVVTDLVAQMGEEGKIDLLIECVNNIFKKLSNRDLINYKEIDLKLLFVSVLSMSPEYILYSEFESDRKYTDLLVLRNSEYNLKYQYLFEFKFIKDETEDKFEKVKETGLKQLSDYIKTEKISSIDSLKAYLIIYSGKKQGRFFEVG